MHQRRIERVGERLGQRARTEIPTDMTLQFVCTEPKIVVAGRNMPAGMLADQQQLTCTTGTMHRERRLDGAQGIPLCSAWPTSHGVFADLDGVMSVTCANENNRRVMICTEVGALSTGELPASCKLLHTLADLIQERA